MDETPNLIPQPIVVKTMAEFGLFKKKEDPLHVALAACIAAESKIETEHIRLTEKLTLASSAAEREALEYQRDLVVWMLKRFAEVARWRLAHLNSLKTKVAWDQEILGCAAETLAWTDPWGQIRATSGVVYWFAMWAWTFDPRRILKTLPFYLFPVQEQALLKIEDAVFVEHGSLLIDKSRDMGVTWLMADWDVYHWLFTDGFAALLGNRTEDEVDEGQGNMDATFNKVRFQIHLLPKEMLPRGFNERKHMTYMALFNPVNGANLSGRAPVADFGRGARRTVIQADEFASWQTSKGYLQYQAMSQTTDSVIISSTVKGVFNKYGELLLDPNMPKVTLDWRDHPWKDNRWYRALPTKYLGAPMSSTDIAQEVDRDPYASQPGQVLTQYNPVHNILTYSEFWRVYAKVRGEHKIPLPGWYVSVGQDVGTTPEHPNVTTWLTRPKENHPYPKFVFVVKEMVRIRYSSRQIAEGVKDEYGRVVTDGFQQYEQEALRGNQVIQRILSHEATNEQLCYQRDCDLYPTLWAKWPGDAVGGIEQWDNALQVNPEIRNPFVIDPRTSDPNRRFQQPDGRVYEFVPLHMCSLCGVQHAGEHLQGCASWFMVVPDLEGELLVDELGKLIRRPAKSEAGLERLRYEMPGWHYPESERGKSVKERKPEKAENDACLVRGTLVETENGPLGIEYVKPGIRVWTRAGLQKILSSGLTGFATEIYTLTTTDGRVISGTGNHPIWTGKGWTRLADIEVGEELVCLNTRDRELSNPAGAARVNSSSFRVSGSTGIPIPRIGAIDTISNHTGWHVHRASRSFMSRFGRAFMDLYRKVVRFITGTKILSITGSRISNAYLSVGTLNTMLDTGTCELLPISNIWPVSASWPVSGMEVLKDLNGTAKTESGSWHRENSSSSLVPGVENVSSLSIHAHGFATTRVRIKTVITTRPLPVFNLAVENNHEYFASGILTHNCDSIRMQMAYWGLSAAPATKEEKIEALMPAQFREEVVKGLEGTPEWGPAAQGRYFNYWEAQRRIERDDAGGLSLYELARQRPF